MRTPTRDRSVCVSRSSVRTRASRRAHSVRSEGALRLSCTYGNAGLAVLSKGSLSPRGTVTTRCAIARASSSTWSTRNQWVPRLSLMGHNNDHSILLTVATDLPSRRATCVRVSMDCNQNEFACPGRQAELFRNPSQ